MFLVTDTRQTEDAFRLVAPYATGEATVDPACGTVSIPVAADDDHLADTVRVLGQANIKVDELSLRRASLDDVFLTLTGHTAEDSFAQQQAVSSRAPHPSKSPPPLSPDRGLLRQSATLR